MQKNVKIMTAKLNLKAQNIYIKPLLKTENNYNKTYFAIIAYLGKNEKNALEKFPKTIGLGLKKVAQMVKNCPIWSPW
jgi:hypothetical protein